MPKIKFTNLMSVQKLRSCLSQDPVVYQWWFPSIPEILRDPTWDIEIDRIDKKEIENQTYYLMYVGIGSHCQQRLSWHIVQRHTLSNVRSGYLSTLRQTLCAILKLDMTTPIAQQKVDELMDKCYVEWNLYPGKSKEDIEDIESELLKKGYYPLNIDKNENLPKQWIRELKKLRKKHKK